MMRPPAALPFICGLHQPAVRPESAANSFWVQVRVAGISSVKLFKTGRWPDVPALFHDDCRSLAEASSLFRRRPRLTSAGEARTSPWTSTTRRPFAPTVLTAIVERFAFRARTMGRHIGARSCKPRGKWRAPIPFAFRRLTTAVAAGETDVPFDTLPLARQRARPSSPTVPRRGREKATGSEVPRVE